MSLSDLAALGSFISGFAVLVSLVFLYFQLRQIGAQVRQAERNQRAIIQQARATRSADTTLRLSEAGISQAYNKGIRGDDDISLGELHQFQTLFRSLVLTAEDSFIQHNDKMMSDTAFNSFMIGIRNIWSEPTSQ